MQRFLVLFTVPVEGGWKTIYRDAVAIVTNDGTMPFGWEPEEIGGYPVGEIKWFIAIPDGELPMIVSGEYNKEVTFQDDGIAVLINDQTMGLIEPSPGDGDIDMIAAPIHPADKPSRHKLDDRNGYIDMPSSDD
jgi:hypothetical protein